MSFHNVKTFCCACCMTKTNKWIYTHKMDYYEGKKKKKTKLNMWGRIFFRMSVELFVYQKCYDLVHDMILKWKTNFLWKWHYLWLIYLSLYLSIHLFPSHTWSVLKVAFLWWSIFLPSHTSWMSLLQRRNNNFWRSFDFENFSR